MVGRKFVARVRPPYSLQDAANLATGMSKELPAGVIFSEPQDSDC